MMRSKPPATGPRVLVSVHDLMPTTLPAVLALLHALERRQIAPLTLLVVPGAGWRASELATLRALAAAGHQLAAHGWQHHVASVRRPYHRLHAALISRQVAEHLALDADGILALLRRSHDWFIAQGFAPPALYVPPAWALGPIPLARLASAGPFAYYELFGGLFIAGKQRLAPLPLLGYEADRAWRTPVIRAWNRRNRARAARCGWLRIGIHPHDAEHALAKDLWDDLARYDRRVALDANFALALGDG